MTDSKQQKIVTLLSFTPADKNVVLNGIKIARIFKKELCLLYNFSKAEKQKKEVFKKKLLDYVFTVKNELPGIKISTLLISENYSVLPEILADEHEAIFIISAASSFSKYARSVRESAVPFLFVNESCERISDFKNIILPVDFRSENKESALWGSYFGRFNQAGIVLIEASDHNGEEKNKVKENIAFAKILFGKFKVEYRVFKGVKSSFRNVFEALELAHKTTSDALIILGSSNLTPLDWLVGIPEKKIIKNAKDLPVIIINPRKDNYVLCD